MYDWADLLRVARRDRRRRMYMITASSVSTQYPYWVHYGTLRGAVRAAKRYAHDLGAPSWGVRRQHEGWWAPVLEAGDYPEGENRRSD